MNILEFTALVLLCSFFAGFLGSLTGLGGGVVIVPLLALVFDVDIRYAAGASLVSVIATSSGAAAAYVKEGFSNIRSGRGIIQLGLLLLLATPVARVIFSVVAFAFQHDWTYVVITLIVLATLGFSLFWGAP